MFTINSDCKTSMVYLYKCLRFYPFITFPQLVSPCTSPSSRWQKSHCFLPQVDAVYQRMAASYRCPRCKLAASKKHLVLSSSFTKNYKAFLVGRPTNQRRAAACIAMTALANQRSSLCRKFVVHENRGWGGNSDDDDDDGERLEA